MRAITAAHSGSNTSSRRSPSGRTAVPPPAAGTSGGGVAGAVAGGGGEHRGEALAGGEPGPDVHRGELGVGGPQDPARGGPGSALAAAAGAPDDQRPHQQRLLVVADLHARAGTDLHAGRGDQRGEDGDRVGLGGLGHRADQAAEEAVEHGWVVRGQELPRAGHLPRSRQDGRVGRTRRLVLGCAQPGVPAVSAVRCGCRGGR
jgi:hypothetical protein